MSCLQKKQKNKTLNLYYRKSCSSLWGIFVLSWAWHVSVIAAINCTALCKGCICCIYLSISSDTYNVSEYSFFGCLFVLPRSVHNWRAPSVHERQSITKANSILLEQVVRSQSLISNASHEPCVQVQIEHFVKPLVLKANFFYGFTVRHRGLTSAVTVETSCERFQEFNRIV